MKKNLFYFEFQREVGLLTIGNNVKTILNIGRACLVSIRIGTDSLHKGEEILCS